MAHRTHLHQSISICSASTATQTRTYACHYFELLAYRTCSHQADLKQLLCNLRNTHTHTSKTIGPEHLFVGVGSDEAIDALIRAFCAPGKEKILTCPPTYGMYSVSAQVNDVSLVKVPLQLPTFDLDVPAIQKALTSDPSIKLAYLCSPGNPTGKLLKKADVQAILETNWNGVVVLDEAYIDFAPEGASMAEWVAEWPNLVVMQTLSKAFGHAGIRLRTMTWGRCAGTG